tara:strand:- start:159 stop:464 length:306 start_codon:yes stop_codon:yes gene_type:complete
LVKHGQIDSSAIAPTTRDANGPRFSIVKADNGLIVDFARRHNPNSEYGFEFIRRGFSLAQSEFGDTLLLLELDTENPRKTKRLGYPVVNFLRIRASGDFTD